MSRGLGERQKYGAYRDTLARAVHYDAHLLRLYADEPTFQFDGMGTSWLIQLGRFQERSELYPRGRQLEEIDAREQRTRDLRQLLDAIEHLRAYDPMLHYAVSSVCMAGDAAITAGRGTRHQGDVWGRVLRETYGGDDGKLWRHLQAGWALVAVLVVEAPILEAAQEAGAVDAKAVSWAKERGLLPEEMELGG